MSEQGRIPADGSRAALPGSADVFVVWNVYDRVNASDGMGHRAIEQAVRRFTLGIWRRPWRLLDLGCGDAAGIGAMFPGATLGRYTGVDAAAGPLESARRRLAAAPFATELVHDDFLRHLSGAPTGAFDLILVGYSLHHLPAGKETFLRECRRVLAHGGWLLLADVYRREGESREAWCDAYLTGCVAHWPGLLPGDRDSIAAHVRAYDHPETPSDMRSLLVAAGFMPAGGAPSELFRDAPGIHRLWALPRPNGADGPAAMEEGRCAS